MRPARGSFQRWPTERLGGAKRPTENQDQHGGTRGRFGSPQRTSDLIGRRARKSMAVHVLSYVFVGQLSAPSRMNRPVTSLNNSAGSCTTPTAAWSFNASSHGKDAVLNPHQLPARLGMRYARIGGKIVVVSRALLRSRPDLLAAGRPSGRFRARIRPRVGDGPMRGIAPFRPSTGATRTGLDGVGTGPQTKHLSWRKCVGSRAAGAKHCSDGMATAQSNPGTGVPPKR